MMGGGRAKLVRNTALVLTFGVGTIVFPHPEITPASSNPRAGEGETSFYPKSVLSNTGAPTHVRAWFIGRGTRSERSF